MSTAIATWGNSEAVRIPRDVLKTAGLRKGDRVNLSLNAAGRIEIVPAAREHRRVRPAKNITFETLFDGYDASSVEAASTGAWPSDDLVGAEWEAWSE